MNADAPLVSVIMPCFNHARFLNQSVLSILEQTYPELELILVNDCSTDNSAELIKGFALRDARVKPLYHQSNQGLSRSRNDALAAARGEFIAFCDSDDIWECSKLAIQVRLLQEHTDCAVTYCDTVIINETGTPTGQSFSDLFPPPQAPSGWLFSPLLKANFINIQSVLLRRQCLDRVGPFAEDIEWVQDWWYWIQLSRHYQFLYYEQPLARYRVHSQSTNVLHRRVYSVNRFKVFRRILRQYKDLSPRVKADLLYQMGIELCQLGKPEPGNRMFREAMRIAAMDPRALGSLLKSLVRLSLRPPPLLTAEHRSP